MRRRNDTARQFEHTSKNKRNCIRISTANSYKHELKKFEVCWEIANNGQEFLTEAVTLDRKRRCDVVNLDLNEIIEIETDHSIQKKGATTIYI